MVEKIFYATVKELLKHKGKEMEFVSLSAGTSICGTLVSVEGFMAKLENQYGVSYANILLTQKILFDEVEE